MLIIIILQYPNPVVMEMTTTLHTSTVLEKKLLHEVVIYSTYDVI